jgi:hypothetical protein
MLKAFDVSNVILHIMLISIFIGTFFFTYGTYLQKKIIKAQLEFLIDETVGSTKVFMPELLSDSVKKFLMEYQINLDNNADLIVEQSNKEIKKKALYANLIGFVIVIIIILIVCKKLDMEGMTKTHFFLKLIGYNSIALLAVGLTYFIFSRGFALYYMPLDLNKIKKKIIDNLIKIRQS